MLVNCARLCRLLIFFQNLHFQKFNQCYSFDPDQDQCLVWPDVGSNYMQRLSADGIGTQIVKGVNFETFKDNHCSLILFSILLFFQDSHDQRRPFYTDLTTHASSLHELLPNVGVYDVQRLVVYCRSHRCWGWILPVWMEKSYSC